MKRQIALADFIDKMEKIGQFQDKIEIFSTLNQIWEILLEEIKNFISVNICALFLVDEQSCEFVLEKVYPENKKRLCQSEVENQIEYGMFSWIINRRKPAVIPSFIFKGTKSIIMLPLSTVKRTLGVVLLITPISENRITQENLKLLTMLAKQCALVMENWYLYHNLRKKHEALEKAKDQIIQTEKMASIGRLTSGASHEILNPLNVISGHIQLLSIKQDLTVNVHKSLRIIKLQTERIKQIIDGLGRFSKNPNSEKKILNINAVIEKFILTADLDEMKKNMFLVKDLDQKILNVLVDEKLMFQVFSFLLSNAVDAFVKKGTLIISTQQEIRYPGTEIERQYVRIDFKDDGCGISNKNILKVFDPFFTTKKCESKSGLGLSLSYRIIKDHNGDMQIRSFENQGTVVSVYLPLQRINLLKKCADK